MARQGPVPRLRPGIQAPQKTGGKKKKKPGGGGGGGGPPPGAHLGGSGPPRGLGWNFHKAQEARLGSGSTCRWAGWMGGRWLALGRPGPPRYGSGESGSPRPERPVLPVCSAGSPPGAGGGAAPAALPPPTPAPCRRSRELHPQRLLQALP